MNPALNNVTLAPIFRVVMSVFLKLEI
jgi:hypothetical protein